MNSPFRSISRRFATAVAGTAVITFISLIGLVIFQLENSLNRQSAQLERISINQFSGFLEADVRHASARLDFLFDDVTRRIKAIANRADTANAVRSRNVVAISELLGRAANSAEVDSIIVLDPHGNVIGASSDKADLIDIEQKLKRLSFHDRLLFLLTQNDPMTPVTMTDLLSSSRSSVFIPGDLQSEVSQMIFAPLFDDFGEIAGGLLAQRWLRPNEKTLMDFARIASVGVEVFYNDKLVSSAELRQMVEIPDAPPTKLGVSHDGDFIFKCGETIWDLRICALKPIETLTSTQSELLLIGKKEQNTLITSLVALGVFGTVFLVFLSIALSKEISNPLTQITKAVCEVAAGKYERVVEGVQRLDEIGDIARAVVVLQASAKERDILKISIENKNKALKSREAELHDQNIRFDAALNNMAHGLCMFDEEKKLTVANHRYLELFGCAANDIHPGMSWSALFAAQNVSQEAVVDAEAPPLPERDDWSTTLSKSYAYKLVSGRIIVMTRQPLNDGGWVVIFEDISERQLARDRLLHLAKHDLLTGLPNRMRFREHLEDLIAKQRDHGAPFGVLCLDLDEFKTVNDSLGHPIGDKLLIQIAEKLSQTIKSNELVVRLGGDEFAIVTEIASSRGYIEQLAQNIINKLALPFQLGDQEVAIGVSIGITIAEQGELNADELLKEADLALYKAKTSGRNTYRFFEQKMILTAKARQTMITDLHNAMSNNEFEVYFQPQVLLETNKISGMEALARWRHPQRGMISPIEFIPIAEETGSILVIGEWVLNRACEEASNWPHSVRLAVNVSARQLQSSRFMPFLIQTLERTGLTAQRLELEVTESALLSDDETTRAALMRIKELGINISMDDFGTGYSSLSCLQSFPFDKIKIDQSFVRKMTESGDASSIVQTVIDLAHRLRITTTAEGVESKELVELLREAGCTEVQGYIFGAPAPAARTLERLLEDVDDDKSQAIG